MSSTGRLLKEYNDIKKNIEININIKPYEDDLYKWKGFIIGPNGTPYQGKSFNIECSVPLSYPLSPPKITFVDQIFHPNVYPSNGEICLDILKNQWTPAWTILFSCQAIIVLLTNPEPNSPLNCDAGNFLRSKDYRGFSSIAKFI
ncbi:ubiquitin-conjugating enzyme E2-21 KD [Guillardia theta]|uniref:Ubiquitin-conjugating enzyme E2-21 KD n=1 Tax=Guillardia theta TaxID=55529 RepID=Q9AW53_GUITH|nr:ubiquitin-conjugating enzyme E2-21 KD [Guillardia theta]CAC27017.1 ubiquitin-conjugating enzyme E2-21 KD [Guillardia theta]|mmetsp:Transcript_17287/g.57197  ORF Transcript_17287/g.57197 Transcript_17287/m.57197 type:complete len:145 (-) Transcript_17287:2408-2842(-)